MFSDTVPAPTIPSSVSNTNNVDEDEDRDGNGNGNGNGNGDIRCWADSFITLVHCITFFPTIITTRAFPQLTH
jgi:hypothetical protein